jgi:hypothetical protein
MHPSLSHSVCFSWLSDLRRWQPEPSNAPQGLSPQPLCPSSDGFSAEIALFFRYGCSLFLVLASVLSWMSLCLIFLCRHLRLENRSNVDTIDIRQLMSEGRFFFYVHCSTVKLPLFLCSFNVAIPCCYLSALHYSMSLLWLFPVCRHRGLENWSNVDIRW